MKRWGTSKRHIRNIACGSNQVATWYHRPVCYSATSRKPRVRAICAISRPLPELRIGAIVVGAERPQLAAEIFEKLEQAARRQLGLQIENLGEVRRDPATFRSLLYGVSVLDLDEKSGSARSLLELCERLGALPSPSG